MKRRHKKNQERRVNNPMVAPEQMEEQVLEDAVQEQEAPETEDAAVHGTELEELPPLVPQAELDAAKAQAEEYLHLAQRVQADFENFRKRNESVRADAYEDGRRAATALILPVLDNLERAVDAAKDDSPLKTGVEMTLKQLRTTLEKLGVQEISRQGELFDPALEEAVMQGDPSEGEPGTVSAVLQKGYTMNGTVLRHAMVRVIPA